MKIILTLFFLFSSANSSYILLCEELDSIKNSKDADVDWPLLYAEFRGLSGLDPKQYKSQSRFFKLKMEIFQARILKFFQLKTVEAFTALENEPGDCGLVLFFIRTLSFNASHDLKVNSKYFFSFDRIIYKNPENAFIKATVSCFSKELNRHKTVDILRIVVRIFEKLKIKLTGKAEVEPLRQAIKMWKYEIHVLDMKISNPTYEASANPEIYIPEKEAPLAPEIILLHGDLCDSFDHLKRIVKSKRSLTNDLVPGFCEKFGHLAAEFVEKSGDFHFILKQGIEFAIIMVDYIFEGDWDYILEKKKIQVNFETLFLNRNRDEMEKLVSTCQTNLRGMTEYKWGIQVTGRFEWLRHRSQVMNNSFKRISDLSEKISRYFSKL
jgi:hypothetical protein